MKTVTVIGLGYVGLPVTCFCAFQYNVIGADIDKEKISQLKDGICPIKDKSLEEDFNKVKGKIKFTSNIEEAVSKSDIVLICVPTPVDKNHKPDLTALKSAATSISNAIKDETLVIIESTIFPGTTEEVILPILKKSKAKKFYLAHCPERIDPGNRVFTIKILPRVVGGIDNESSDHAFKFYKSLIGETNTIQLGSVKAVEATKMMENTFRDVNIAFVNEMAKSFDKEGIDIMEVIEGAKTKFSFMAHYPGAGVGGHCIPVDPYYLIEKAKSIGFSHKFLRLAREINNSMPFYTVELLENELKKIDQKIKNANVGILGLAYKADVDDTRESPAFEIINMLKEKNANVIVFDPYVKRKDNAKNLDELMKQSDYIILVTNHSLFKDLEIKLKENNIKIIIDGRNCLNKENIKNSGIIYHGIGRS